MPVHDGPALLAAWAATTTRIRIDLLIANVVIRRPTLLTKQAVTIDHVSAAVCFDEENLVSCAGPGFPLPGRFGVGGERVVPPQREQLVGVVAVAYPPDDEPGGDLVFRASERGVVDFGDLGVGDQLAGVGVEDGPG